MINKKKIKKINIFTFFIILFLVNIIIVKVTAEPIVEILVGDEWTYDVNDTSNVLNAKEYDTKTVKFNVVNISYIEGEKNTEMKVNEINSSLTVDEYKIYKFNIKFTIEEVSINSKGDTATIELTFFNPINDIIYKTSRGNILYKRITIFNLNITATDITYAGKSYPDYNTTIEGIKMIELCSNPSIIETVSTGVVQTNSRIIQIEKNMDNIIYIDSFIGKKTQLKISEMKFVIEERYESSNIFSYDNKDCRNITITTKEAYIEDLLLTGDTEFWSLQNLGRINSNKITYNKENWIYSYDIGLPLYIDKIYDTTNTKYISIYNEKEINILPLPRLTMKLIDFNIQNSNYNTNKTKVSTTTLLLVIILMMFISVVVINNRE